MKEPDANISHFYSTYLNIEIIEIRFVLLLQNESDIFLIVIIYKIQILIIKTKLFVINKSLLELTFLFVSPFGRNAIYKFALKIKSTIHAFNKYTLKLFYCEYEIVLCSSLSFNKPIL